MLRRLQFNSKKVANKKLFSQLSHLDDFDQDVFLGDAVNSRQQIFRISNGSVDWECRDKTTDGFSTVIDKTVKVRTLETFFNERMGR